MQLKLQQAEQEKSRDRALTEKLEKLKLQQAVELERERIDRETASAADRLEASATIAQEAMLLDEVSTYTNCSIQEINRASLTQHRI